MSSLLVFFPSTALAYSVHGLIPVQISHRDLSHTSKFKAILGVYASHMYTKSSKHFSCNLTPKHLRIPTKEQEQIRTKKKDNYNPSKLYIPLLPWFIIMGGGGWTDMI